MKNLLLLPFIIVALFIISSCTKQADATASCPTTSCQNGGTVTLTDTICSCTCGNGYTGDSCQYNGLGSYNALRVNTSNNSTTNVVVTITALGSALNIAIPGASLQASFTASTTFGLSTQTVGGIAYSGNGTFTPHNLSMSLTQGGVVYNYNGLHQ